MTPCSRLSLFRACATAHLLYCETGPEHVEPTSSENSRSKVPTKTNPLPGPSAFSLTSKMVFHLALWVLPSERRCPFCWSLFSIFKGNIPRQLFQFGHNSVYLYKNTNHLWANLLSKNSSVIFISPNLLLYFHPCATASCRERPRTSPYILCMNDCTLPIHLNSTLHITSTLIWAIKCVFCTFVFVFIAVHIAVVVPWLSLVLLRQQLGSCCWNDFPPQMTSLDDRKRWKCFTTHFRTFVVINKLL